MIIISILLLSYNILFLSSTLIYRLLLLLFITINNITYIIHIYISLLAISWEVWAALMRTRSIFN